MDSLLGQYVSAPTPPHRDAIIKSMRRMSEVDRQSLLSGLNQQFVARRQPVPPTNIPIFMRALSAPVAPASPIMPPLQASSDARLLDQIRDRVEADVFSAEQAQRWEQAADKYGAYLSTILNFTHKVPHTPLEQLLSSCEPLRNIYTVAEFLRSFLDFHHDFLDGAWAMLDNRPMPTSIAKKGENGTIMQQFESEILRPMQDQRIFLSKEETTLGGWYNKWIARLYDPINGMYGKGVDEFWPVSQHRCEVCMDDLVDDLLRVIGDPRNVTAANGVVGLVNWIPLTREQAKVGDFVIYDNLSASAASNQDMDIDADMDDEEVAEEILKRDKKVYDEDVIKALRTKLNDMGVQECFVESMNSSFYRRYFLGPTMKNIKIPISNWDGASGYSTTSNATRDAPAAASLDLFGGVATVSVRQDTLTMTIKGKERDPISIRGVQKLSLDKVLSEADKDAIRRKLSRKMPARFKKESFTRPRDRKVLSHLPLLKTWTDYVQVRALSSIHASSSLSSIQRPISTITLDRCCEITMRMYGLPFVMFSRATKQRTTIELLCYDSDANTIHQREQNLARIRTAAALLSQYDHLVDFLRKWYIDKRDFLLHLRDHTLDPVLYISIKGMEQQMEESYAAAMQNLEQLGNLKMVVVDLYTPNSAEVGILHQQMITFPTSLNEWLHRVTDSSALTDRLLGVYENLQRDIERGDWVERYHAVKQRVENAMPPMSPLRLHATVVAVLVGAEMRRCSKDSLEEIKEALDHLMDQQMQMRIGPYGIPAHKFVGKKDMVDTFASGNWQAQWTALQVAKETVWKSDDALPLSDAMETYHAMLADQLFAERMDALLLCGAVISQLMIEAVNATPARSTKRRTPTPSMEVEARSKAAASPATVTPARLTRATRGTPLQSTKVNDAFALQGTLRTWCSLFGATGRVEFSFHSFVDRIMQFMCQRDVSWEVILSASIRNLTHPLCAAKFGSTRYVCEKDLTSKEERDAMEQRRVAALEARCREVPALRIPAASPIPFDNQPPNEEMPNVVSPKPKRFRGTPSKGGNQTRKRRT